MWAVTKKELLHFLGNPAGYIAIVIYVILSWLYLFIFPNTNFFDYKYATLSTYFDVAPWLFMFLSPAIAMRSFAEEIRSGTIERLLTFPLSFYDIVIGKYLACVFISLICIFITLPFLWTVYQLADSEGFDVGATFSGYISLFFLTLVFNAISIFASVVQRQMLAAFFVGVLCCFVLFVAVQAFSLLKIAEGSWDYYLQWWGIQFHYSNMKRGVLDLRDVIYFLSLSIFFLYWSIHTLEKWVYKKK